MRLRTWTATSTSVARRSSVCARNRSPITCFHRPMAASARARFVYPDALCQAMRPCSAMCWRWRSRCVGALSAVWLGTAVARGGTMTRCLGVALGDAGVNTILIVTAIARERHHRSFHLVEQGTGLGAVIHVVGGQRRGDDLAGVGIHTEVQFAPRPSCLGAVFLDQPLAG